MKHHTMDNRLLSQLPDELYRVIMEYNSSYMKEIPRLNKRQKWRSHCNKVLCLQSQALQLLCAICVTDVYLIKRRNAVITHFR